MTREQVNMVQRCEAASANSVEGYTLFFGAGEFDSYSLEQGEVREKWSET